MNILWYIEDGIEKMDSLATLKEENFVYPSLTISSFFM